ncbi:MAG: hypothetical protein GY719_35660 [bacterium]|nr:hypothetical protein [bacterium]
MRSTQRLVTTITLALALAGAAELGAGFCVPGPETLCLVGNRFAVEVDWEDFDSATGNGQVMPIAVGDSVGFLYFDDARYLELMIKVLDGCAINGRFWVFAAGLSDYFQTLTVTDTATAVARTYVNPLGEYPHLIDTAAFATCPRSRAHHRDVTRQWNATALELIEGRFSLEVEWRDFVGATGSGQPVALTSHSGYFWFFSNLSPELAVKLLDASTLNGNFWVTFGATTDVEINLRVTDQLCRATRSYLKPLGAPGETVSDRDSFAATADCVIFGDGFENGNLSAWSGSVP